MKLNKNIINPLLYIYLLIIFFIYPIISIIVILFSTINELFIKNIIKEKRPNGLEYGMPSSHALSYSLLTLLLINNNYLLLIISLILLLITCISKYINNEHSIKQLIVGSSIGSIIGYLINSSKLIN
jgi:membrane-associated phospholipid phosphatase